MSSCAISGTRMGSCSESRSVEVLASMGGGGGGGGDSESADQGRYLS